MAAKITENGKKRSRKATSNSSPVVVEPRKKDVVSASAPAVRHLDNVEEQIRRRAYELYLERGGMPGNESQDWLVAEQQVRSREMEHAG